MSTSQMSSSSSPRIDLFEGLRDLKLENPGKLRTSGMDCNIYTVAVLNTLTVYCLNNSNLSYQRRTLDDGLKSSGFISSEFLKSILRLPFRGG